MTRQLRFPDIEDFEECLIFEKRMKVALEEAKNLNERAADVPMSEYVKNKVSRIITFVKNADLEWELQEKVVRQIWDTRYEAWTDARNPTELVEFHDMRQYNRDLLPIDAFVDQGTSQPKDPRFPSDKAIQRECVMGKNGQLLAFHLKNEEKKPFWIEPEWIMKTFECSDAKATRLSQIFEALGFGKTTVFELIKPIKEDDQMVDYLDALREDLPELPRDMIRDEPFDTGEISEYTLGHAWPDRLIKERAYLRTRGKDEEKAQESNPFGLHPLHYEEDGCSHEFLTFLRFATIKEIKGIMKGFFPSRGLNGYVSRPKFWYLTGSQKSQAWRYINDRRMELGIYETKLSLG